MPDLTQSHTPDKVTIQPRDVRFDLSDLLAGNWCANDAFRTDFSNALSVSFPRGEKFFVDAVRPFIPQLTDEKLKQEALDFVKQESMHRREHERFNTELCKARRYNKAAVESVFTKRIAKSSSFSPLVQLSITVCVEHLTAIFANGVLTDKRWLEGVDPRMKELWLWHAIEETEHKSVAYDVFLAVGGQRSMLHKTMKLVIVRFFFNMFRTMRLMRKESGQPLAPISYWYRGLRGLFGKGGIVASRKSEYQQFFNDEFHPWDHDNHHLIDRALSQLTVLT